MKSYETVIVFDSKEGFEPPTLETVGAADDVE